MSAEAGTNRVLPQDLDVQWMPIGKVKPYPRNPRANDAAVDSVARSISEFGWRQPIVVDRDMVVVAGHTRLKAAKKLRLKVVPVHVAANLTPEQARAYRLMDNRSHDFSGWDMPVLQEELAELELAGYDLSLTGWSQLEVASAELAGVQDEDAEPPELPDYISFVVTPEERREIEDALAQQRGANPTERLLWLIRSR